MRNPWLWTAVLLLAVIVIITSLSNAYPSAPGERVDLARLIYLIAFLAFIGSGFFASNRLDISTTLKMALGWVAIFAVLIVGYTYRHDFMSITGRVGNELAPANAMQESSGAVVLNRQQNGHFGVIAKVNGNRVPFMVDTGASDVALTYRDAERAGLEPWNLDFKHPYQTANGVAYGAKVDIQSITIGDITLHNIKGSVLKDGLDVSLLGLSYLDRLNSYNVSGNKMTLRR